MKLGLHVADFTWPGGPTTLADDLATIAVEAAHLRWILLTQWTCKACGDPHIHCECKPAWVKKLL